MTHMTVLLIKNTVKPPLMATSPDSHLSTMATFSVLEDGPYIHLYFNLSTAATSPQWQQQQQPLHMSRLPK